jgi:hypothetical protein
MSTDRPKRNSMSIEEATASNFWEIAAILEVLERLGWIIEMGQRVAKRTTHYEI